MSSTTVLFRFPAERSEYRLNERTPKVGDLLERNGNDWVVVTVDEPNGRATIVTLGHRPKSAQPSGRSQRSAQ